MVRTSADGAREASGGKQDAPPRDCERAGALSLRGNRKALATLFNNGVALLRELPAWLRSETGDFYLTILFTAVATAELTPLVPLAALVAVWCDALPRGDALWS